MKILCGPTQKRRKTEAMPYRQFIKGRCFWIGPPGIGKTAIMEQIADDLQVGLVAYTITHHTRQSAVGLPVIEKRQFDGKEYTVTEYTMSEIVASSLAVHGADRVQQRGSFL